jgi:hypothetical protein
VAFSPEAAATEDTLFTEMRVTCRARPGFPVEAEGTIRITSRDHPAGLDLPYRFGVPPGQVVVRLEAPQDARPLPAAGDAEPWRVAVESQNANVPRLVRVEAVLEPAAMAREVTARLSSAGGLDVAWDLTTPIELRADAPYALRFELSAGVLGTEGSIRLRLPEQRGVEGETVGVGRIARRNPRLVPSAASGTYRMDGGETTGDPPLRLEVDADGGTGAWRLALLEITPVVTAPADALFDLEVKPEEPGRWVLVPAGAWRGERADTFASRTHTFELQVAWEPGGAPLRIPVTVEVEPRWGPAGWILVGLAVLAVVLGLWGVTQLRAAPVAGTLLYTVRGREGAVGRLDLSPAGRRKTAIHADDAGRLHLGPGAGAPVAIVKPTRVGGLLLVAGDDGSGGDAGEASHLLVDGLSVSTKTHGLRYVSGRPDTAVLPPVPAPEADLLGPEFDMQTGRFAEADAEDADGPPATEN